MYCNATQQNENRCPNSLKLSLSGSFDKQPSPRWAGILLCMTNYAAGEAAQRGCLAQCQWCVQMSSVGTGTHLKEDVHQRWAHLPGNPLTSEGLSLCFWFPALLRNWARLFDHLWCLITLNETSPRPPSEPIHQKTDGSNHREEPDVWSPKIHCGGCWCPCALTTQLPSASPCDPWWMVSMTPAAASSHS